MSEATTITLIIAAVVLFALLLFNKVKVLVQLKSFIISLDVKDSRRGRARD
jgi:hypothetical protein